MGYHSIFGFEKTLFLRVVCFLRFFVVFLGWHIFLFKEATLWSILAICLWIL